MAFPNEKSRELPIFFSEYTSEIGKALQAIDIDNLEKVVGVLDSAIKRNSAIYTCGNGGSSSIAEHFVCDFLKGTSTGSLVQPVMHSLSSNTPTITAVANDIGYEEIFSFQLERFARTGDVLLCVSSSW